MLRKVPIIVILGSTGTGKTKLSIELAKKFNGEIISADSMQVYKGLDIVTAKATKEEQKIVPHHLLDVANPGIPFTVVSYQNKALPIIDDLLSRAIIPIIVGGTNYYIESLIWQVLVHPPLNKENLKRTEKDSDQNPNKKMKLPDKVIESIKNDGNDKIQKFEIVPDNQNKTNEQNEDTSNDENECISLNEVLKMNVTELEMLTSLELHHHLEHVDPESANRLHPNNKRKIIRALEVFINSGKSLTSILNDQRNIEGGNSLGGPLRYSHVVIFWLTCDQEILNARLNKRISSMLSEGLLKEIREFYDNFVNPYNKEVTYTKGILQTIGFKEFSQYLQKYDENEDNLITNFLNLKEKDENVKEPEGFALLNQCLEELKVATQRYSKKQIKWVKNRLLGSKGRQVPPIYELNTSDPTYWNTMVFELADDILSSFIENKEPMKCKPMNNIENSREGMNEEVTNFCKTCHRVFIGEFQWNIHLKSKKHKKVSCKKRKLKV